MLADIAQSVVHRIRNPKVASSILAISSIVCKSHLCIFTGVFLLHKKQTAKFLTVCFVRGCILDIVKTSFRIYQFHKLVAISLNSATVMFARLAASATVKILSLTIEYKTSTRPSLRPFLRPSSSLSINICSKLI